MTAAGAERVPSPEIILTIEPAKRTASPGLIGSADSRMDWPGPGPAELGGARTGRGFW